jgi:class 3 adenylate cyclase
LSQSRQLASIMFTDIVGYTALMGRDEERTFALLKKNRELQKPVIESFNGRFIKELGDGIMASFNTVSDSVNAALLVKSRKHLNGSTGLLNYTRMMRERSLMRPASMLRMVTRTTR